MGAGGDILATRFKMGSTFSNTTELSVIALIQVIKIIRKRMLYYQVGGSRGKKRFVIDTWTFFMWMFPFFFLCVFGQRRY